MHSCNADKEQIERPYGTSLKKQATKIKLWVDCQKPNAITDLCVTRKSAASALLEWTQDGYKNKTKQKPPTFGLIKSSAFCHWRQSHVDY